MGQYKNAVSYKLVKEKTDIEQVKINGSKTASEFAKKFYFDDLGIFESFFMIMLNQQNKTIGYVKISQGGINGTLVDVRIVAKYAIDSLATAVILVHNHPSGNLRPSEADKQLTIKVQKGLETLDVKVLDHLIITEESYLSFADEGIL